MSQQKYLSVDYTKEDAPLKILPNAPISSSHQLGWHGFRIAHYQQPIFETPEHSSPQHLISIFLGKPTIKERRLDGRLEVNRFVNGDISITPANITRQIRSHGETDFIHIYLEPLLTAHKIHEVDSQKIEIIPQFKLSDPLIQHIGLALKAELQLCENSNRLYVDSLISTLSIHLLRHYSGYKQIFRDYKNGLSQDKLKFIIEYIDNHLEDDLSLEILANQVEISEYYFCYLFKKSLGITPHQYIIQQRIGRAKELLLQGKATMTEIAFKVGFASHSHFCRVFKQFTGVTPRDYQK